MANPVRTTDQNVASHRRLVLRTMVAALQSVFGQSYDRDPQFVGLKITSEFPLVEVDYPCVTIEYEPQRVANAGVGHEEWFVDNDIVLRKWHHRRFEGEVTFNIFGLSSFDRDILSDAVMEVMSFGRLDPNLLPFFTTLYGDPNAPVSPQFSQLMLNIDEISFGGDSATIAPWAPEDKMIYSSSLSTEIHGGFYNVLPVDTWGYVTRASAESYPQGDQTVTIEFSDSEQALPFPDPDTVWTNPLEYDDSNLVTSKSVVSSDDSLN